MKPRTLAELDEFVRRYYAPEHRAAKRNQWAGFYGIATAEQKAAEEQAARERRAVEERAHFEEQARFDAQYQARQQQRLARAVAERELERQAAKDDGWRLRHRVAKRVTETANQKIARECGHVHETFALAGRLNCAELGRSELDLLGDLEVPIVGGLINAHARRRAFFTKVSASSRPVSLARAA